VHVLTRASSVRWVVRVTGNFTSESPLHPAAKSALLAAFDQGWADPKKISQNSAKAAILKNQALENIAAVLGVKPDSLEVIGEPALGHFLGIGGLLHHNDTFVYAATDKGKIRAVARSHSGAVEELKVDSEGKILYPRQNSGPSVLSLQLANSETGVIQEFPQEKFSCIAIDSTTSGTYVALPEKWDTALFDAQSWQGPAGLAILAINTPRYKYPIPHIAPIKSPGTYSLPLLIAAAVALENFTPVQAQFRSEVARLLAALPGIRVVAPNAPSIPNKISFTVDGVAGEQLVRTLAEQEVDVDTGSACSPADLQPSHVLAAMGYPTSGQLRLTLHNGVTSAEVENLAQILTKTLQLLRG
jgi:cysteine desulfurase